MKKMCKIIWLMAMLGLLCVQGWSAENPNVMTDNNLLIAGDGHGDGGGPYGPGDCDPDGPWWLESSIKADTLLIAHNGHGDGDGGGPYTDGECDGDGPWWILE